MTDNRKDWSALRRDDPIVVIGAGITGLCAASDLLQAGARRLIVIDRAEPAGGTTAAGAGFVAPWSAGDSPLGPPGLDLEQFSLDFYRGLHTAGHDIGYKNNGNLVLSLSAATAQRVTSVVTSPLAPAGTRELSPRQVQELTGVVRGEAVRSAALMPDGIQIETDRVARELARRLAELGADLRIGPVVETFHEEHGRVTEVITDSGVVRAAAVVIAAGAWTNDLLAPLGHRLPLLPVVATRIVTQPLDVPASMPTIQCPDFGLWIRERSAAFTWGCGPYHARSALAPDATVLPRPRVPALLDAELAAVAGFEQVIPKMGEARVESWLQGMPVYTPDYNLMVGRLPGTDNVVVLGGDNESGVSHGPGTGRFASELVRGVTPFVDLRQSRLDRFPPGEYPDEKSVAMRLAALGQYVGGFERGNAGETAATH